MEFSRWSNALRYCVENDCNLPFACSKKFVNIVASVVRSLIHLHLCSCLYSTLMNNKCKLQIFRCDADDWSTAYNECAKRYKFNQFRISWLSLWLFGIALSSIPSTVLILCAHCTLIKTFVCLVCVQCTLHIVLYTFISSTHFKCLI